MENLFYWTRPHGTPESLSLRWRGATANDFLLTLSRVWLFATPRTVAHQVPLSVGFPRQEFCGGLPPPTPGDLPNLWMEPTSLASSGLARGFFTTVLPGTVSIVYLLPPTRWENGGSEESPRKTGCHFPPPPRSWPLTPGDTADQLWPLLPTTHPFPCYFQNTNCYAVLK